MSGNPFKDFINELKRRNVVKVGIAYIALGWLVIQVTDVAVPALNLPETINSIVVYIGIIGLPFALFFAWVYELTPDGVIRTEEVDVEQSITKQTSQKINYVIIALLSVSVLWLLYDRESAAPPEFVDSENMPSIAVLAFADFSPDQDQEYFADGISDEILNLLVKTKGMVVTGRTSSFAFKGKDDDIPSIANQLNVEHILEGSISKSANRIKVTAQLNDANGVHLWSETYTRELTDIFDIQEEIAAEITRTLADEVGIEIKTVSATRTNNIEAYEDYIRGRELLLKRGYDELREASLLFLQTIAKDPNYAPAWRDLASVYSVMESYDVNGPPQEVIKGWRNTGLAAAIKAIELDPDDAESHAVKAAFHTYDFDYDAGLKEMSKALELSPNNSHILDFAAQIFIEFGYHKQGVEVARKAVEIDPLVAIYRVTLSRHLYSQGKLSEGIEQSKHAILLNDQLRFPYRHIIRESLSQRDFKLAEEIFEMSQKANIDLSLSEEQFTKLLVYVQNYQPGDVPPVELTGLWNWIAVIAVADKDQLMSIYSRAYNNELRTNNLLFEIADPIFNTGLWKAEIREKKLFDLWLRHGFPEHCRQVNNDDFECTPRTITKVDGS